MSPSPTLKLNFVAVPCSPSSDSPREATEGQGPSLGLVWVLGPLLNCLAHGALLWERNGVSGQGVGREGHLFEQLRGKKGCRIGLCVWRIGLDGEDAEG